MIKNKKYLLFDNDGVLVETEKWYFEASKRSLKEYFNINFHFEDYMYIMKHGGAVWAKAENLGFSQEQINLARTKRNIYYQEYLKIKDISIHNVQNVLQELSKKYKMAIVTTSRRVDFEIIHQNSGIVQHMDFVLCEEDYQKAKPHPDPYLKALNKFNAQNHEALVIEDSQRGLQSALNAQIDCAIIYNEFTKTQNFEKSAYKLDNFSNLLELLD
jgi:HAD superfamily hydrolase (TIGR01509 family)